MINLSFCFDLQHVQSFPESMIQEDFTEKDFFPPSHRKINITSKLCLKSISQMLKTLNLKYNTFYRRVKKFNLQATFTFLFIKLKIKLKLNTRKNAHYKIQLTA